MKEYLVAVAIGGIMGDPKIEYIDFDTIEAQNAEEARKLYNEKHNCHYYYGSVMATKTKNGVKVNNKRVTYEQIEKFKIG